MHLKHRLHRLHQSGILIRVSGVHRHRTPGSQQSARALVANAATANVVRITSSLVFIFGFISLIEVEVEGGHAQYWVPVSYLVLQRPIGRCGEFFL